MLFKFIGCLARGLLLLCSWRCQFDKSAIHKTIRMRDGLSFRVFRRVAIRAIDKPAPEATFIIRFMPKGMSVRANVVFSYIPMVVMLGFPGFRSKYWCVDDQTGRCQGVYEWQRIEDAQHYSASFAVGFMEMRSVPGSISFEIIDQRGIPNSGIYSVYDQPALLS